jgi:hypothetical protein
LAAQIAQAAALTFLVIIPSDLKVGQL